MFYALCLLLWVLLDVQLDSAEDEDASANGGGAVRPTPLGRVASLYYLQHTTAALIAERFRGRQLTHTEVRRAGHGVSDAPVWWFFGALGEGCCVGGSLMRHLCKSAQGLTNEGSAAMQYCNEQVGLGRQHDVVCRRVVHPPSDPACRALQGQAADTYGGVQGRACRN